MIDTVLTPWPYLYSRAVLKATRLDAKLFGEGITIYNNELIMLTWQEKTGQPITNYT